MQPFRRGPEMNEPLKIKRGISFEPMAVATNTGGWLDVMAKPNPAKSFCRRVFVVASDACASRVPGLERGDHFFPNTVIPSRKATRDCSRPDDRNGQD